MQLSHTSPGPQCPVLHRGLLAIGAIPDMHLLLLLKKFGAFQDFDDCLFLAIAFTAFHRLLLLGELVVPDDPSKLVFRKLVLGRSVDIIVPPTPYIVSNFFYPLTKWMAGFVVVLF
jgi:hypothetical protein